jgi:hypothetical protein
MKPNRPCLSCGLVALLLMAAAAATAQQEAPCTTPQHRQFDFWAGSWEVTTPDGKVAGTNTIRSILNGCVLEESWEGAGGSIGKSFNMYYARDHQWHQSWVDGAGRRLDLAGGLDDGGRMVLSGRMPGPDGAEVLHEISWEDLGDGTVKQHWRVSRDGGEAWQDAFVGIYRPAGETKTHADGRD